MRSGLGKQRISLSCICLASAARSTRTCSQPVAPSLASVPTIPRAGRVCARTYRFGVDDVRIYAPDRTTRDSRAGSSAGLPTRDYPSQIVMEQALQQLFQRLNTLSYRAVLAELNPPINMPILFRVGELLRSSYSTFLVPRPHGDPAAVRAALRPHAFVRTRRMRPTGIPGTSSGNLQDGIRRLA
jgi:hypothetical protein